MTDDRNKAPVCESEVELLTGLKRTNGVWLSMTPLDVVDRVELPDGEGETEGVADSCYAVTGITRVINDSFSSSARLIASKTSLLILF